MKAKIAIIALAFGFFGHANAQLQLTNAGFEDWEEVTYSKQSGYEPKSWSSFLDGTGKLKSAAGYSQLEKSTDKPESSKGSYSAKLTSRAVKIGVVTLATAQGNLTNGCINMGSTTATDATGNYNYVVGSKDGARADQNMSFTGHPDAVKVWVKFKGNGNYGNVEVVLVSDGYYQSPEANDITAKKVAYAQNKEIESNDTWKEIEIPFTYAENVKVNPEYCLVNISTCATPGGGKEADYMYVDDITMVYNSSLAGGATYNGTDLRWSAGKATVDEVYDASKLVLESNGKGATIERSYDEATAKLTVTVKGEDISVNSGNYHNYYIQFASPTPTVGSLAKTINAGTSTKAEIDNMADKVIGK